MRRPSLTTLANDPNLIPGIYNYCDRWCERCPLTSRCLVYATEQDDNVSSESQDIRNADFWRQLNSIMDETRQMIAEWANQAGIDLTRSEDEHQTRKQRRRQLVDNHPLTKAAKKYANVASDWFRELDQTIQSEKVDPDSREVIQWYQYQIAVKTMRALSGRNDEPEADPELAEHPKDSDGSAKVALIGIDRSIAAWRLMQLSLPEHTDSVVPLILQLERLRNRVEKHFPDARAFVRPGFDDAAPQPSPDPPISTTDADNS
jgi:hypothetical protein